MAPAREAALSRWALPRRSFIRRLDLQPTDSEHTHTLGCVGVLAGGPLEVLRWRPRGGVGEWVFAFPHLRELHLTGGAHDRPPLRLTSIFSSLLPALTTLSLRHFDLDVEPDCCPAGLRALEVEDCHLMVGEIQDSSVELAWEGARSATGLQSLCLTTACIEWEWERMELQKVADRYSSSLTRLKLTVNSIEGDLGIESPQDLASLPELRELELEVFDMYLGPEPLPALRQLSRLHLAVPYGGAEDCCLDPIWKLPALKVRHSTQPSVHAPLPYSSLASGLLHHFAHCACHACAGSQLWPHAGLWRGCSGLAGACHVQCREI